MVLPVAALARGDAETQRALIAHGEYIVHRVGMCADCHTPRDERGEPVSGQDLRGASIPFSPDEPIPGWTNRSVSIAGRPAGYTDAELVKFLETGATPSGGQAQPPMPSYRMSKYDAKAVVAYLHTLH